MTQSGTLDLTDLKILGILQQDARTEASHIARQVHKTPAAVGERIRKMRARGFIRQYTALLDRRLLDRPILMIAMVKLRDNSAAVSSAFLQLMKVSSEVQVCYQLSGEFDFMLQLTFTDPLGYKLFLDTKIYHLTMVEKVQSSLVIEEHKMELSLPLL